MSAGRRGNLEGSIYEDKKGRRWRAEMWMGYRDGKPWRKKFSGATRDEVATKLKRALAMEHHPEAPERLTLESFLNTWLEDVVKARTRPRTYERYKSKVDLHLIPGIGKVRLQALTPLLLQRFFNQVGERVRPAKNGGEGKKLSPTSVRDIRAVLRNALATAVKWRMLTRNPVPDTDPPRMKRPELRTLDAQQAARFLRRCAKHRLGALFTLAVHTGMSQGEILGLPWSNVDLKAGTLAIKQSLQRVAGGLEIAETKAQSRVRTIALSPEMVQVLKAHRQRQDAEKLRANRWDDSGLVFTTPIGTPLDKRNVTRIHHALLAQAKVPRVRFHDLRHSAATLLIADGAHPRAVMELLGHSTIRVTMDVYSHIMDGTKRETAAAMSRILSAKSGGSSWGQRRRSST